MARRLSAAHLLVAPALGYMLFFVGYPLVEGLRLAFTGPGGGFSLENLHYFLYESRFREALLVTSLLVATVIPIEVVLALLLSLLFYRSFRGRDAALYIVILPLVISDVAAGLIWYAMLTPNGFLNKLLISLGLRSEPFYVFGYQYRAREFLAVVATEVWRSTAIVFVILFAGLQMVTRDLIEAAEVFGANWLQKLRHIIYPMLKPSLQAALIIRTLFAFQVFADVWILAGRDLPVLAGEAYYELAELRHEGVAALYALVIAAISLGLGALYVKLFRARFLEAQQLEA